MNSVQCHVGQQHKPLFRAYDTYKGSSAISFQLIFLTNWDLLLFCLTNVTLATNAYELKEYSIDSSQHLIFLTESNSFIFETNKKPKKT